MYAPLLRLPKMEFYLLKQKKEYDINYNIITKRVNGEALPLTVGEVRIAYCE